LEDVDERLRFFPFSLCVVLGRPINASCSSHRFNTQDSGTTLSAAQV
jgi:hypothetical protein